ncbi:MAG TPA: EamA family transporter RarD, partial [Caulobacter sp.]|nr:EamA family transporter RarD [Caulobacter sp.]
MSADLSKAPNEARTALIAAVGCYVIWGVLPLYFHLLAVLGVGSWEMIAHRTLWAAPWALLIVMLSRQGGQVMAVLRQPKPLLILACSTAAIFINWSIYVFAVNSGHVIETSLGYYINPLMNMAAGAILFRERIRREGAIAIGLAAIGVAIQTAALGHLPIISLGVAISFCAYAILRKQVKADAQTGLFIECAYLAIPGLIYVLHLQSTGAGHFGGGAGVTGLLLAAGPATVIPLALFAWSARRMPLSAMGFLQFIAPTLQFGVGVALGEAFTP